MKKILITGAGGYIGSIATYMLLARGCKVVGIDNFATGFKNPLQLLQKQFGKDQFRYYELDLKENISILFEKESRIGKPPFDGVIHYAASCLVDESMRIPQKYFKNNVLGTLNLLENMSKCSIRNIVFSSSASVYGQSQYVPIDESHPTIPINPYGESKLMSEKIITWYYRLFGIRYLIFRYFNVCGASDDGLIGDSKRPSTLLVQNAVRGALGIEQFYLNCPKVNTPDNTPLRDYINVVDLNEAHIVGLDYLEKNGKSEILNLGTGTGNSVLEVVRLVENAAAKKISVKETIPRIGDPERLISSIKKAGKILDWKPKKTIKDSVNSLLKWYKKHPNGWKN